MSSFIAFGVGTSVSLDEMLAPVAKGAYVVGDGPGNPPEEVTLTPGSMFVGDAGPATGVRVQTIAGFVAQQASAEIITGQWEYSGGAAGYLLPLKGDTGTIIGHRYFIQGFERWRTATTGIGGWCLEAFDAAGLTLGQTIGVSADGAGISFSAPLQMTVDRITFKDTSSRILFQFLNSAVGKQWGLQVPDVTGYTADHNLSIVQGDLDVILTLTGDATLNQDVSTAGSPTFNDLRVTGNIIQDGPVVVVTAEQMNVSDNHIYLNNGYTSAAAQTGGHVVNNGTTGLTDTVAAGGFTAGVAATSNPTVATAGAATFAAGDLVQIEGAGKDVNDGLYEALSHAGNLLTVRGVGVTGRDEDFTQNDFTTDTTVAGRIDKVNISVDRAGTDGIWETAKGAVTGFVFSDSLLASDIGSTVQADLDVVSQGDAEAGTATNERIWTAERVAQAIAALAGSALDNNFIFSHDTTTQAMSVANIFQDLDFSANEGSFNGWTHTPGTNVFGCNQTGSYDVKLVTKWRKSTGGIASYGVRALFDGTEVVGSMDGDEIAANNQTIGLTTFFSVDGVDGQDLKIEAVGSTTNLSVVPAPNPGSATTAVSAKITITRRS